MYREDQKSFIKKRPWSHINRLPITNGGPIIVCLDTSHSMSGARESLAKAVVLECSIQANKNNRPFYVLAFSGGHNLAECSLPLGATNSESLARLLSFLGHSFGGGTDVTGPLERAIELIETSVEWTSADILLVSDGELQMPPVSNELISKLRRYEVERQLEIFGLLVGRESSEPLSMLCTSFDGVDRVYDFLSQYDSLTMMQMEMMRKQREPVSSSTPVSASSRADLSGSGPYDSGYYDSATTPGKSKARGLSSALYATRPSSHMAEYPGTRRRMYGQRSSGRCSLQNSAYRLYATTVESDAESSIVDYSDAADYQLIDTDIKVLSYTDALTIRTHINTHLTTLLASKYQQYQHDHTLIPTFPEPNLKFDLRSTLTNLSFTLQQGLFERETEVKLMLLAVLTREHVLFLGKPGSLAYSMLYYAPL